jgi:Ankyrin repeats (3 copies)/Ankyrin repeat
MPKQRIDAKDAIRDIQSGAGDSTLMEKYNISSRGLQSLFKRLVGAGLLKQEEIDRRMNEFEETVDLVWKCPSCGNSQISKPEECPQCGVVVAKLKPKIEREDLVSRYSKSMFSLSFPSTPPVADSFSDAFKKYKFLIVVVAVTACCIGLVYLLMPDMSSQRLAVAVRQGNLVKASGLLADGANANAKDENGTPVLITACRAGNTAVVELLLAYGADPEAKDKYGNTAFVEAAAKGMSGLARLLLKKGVDVNAKSKDGWTALMWASHYGHADLVELLLSEGAHVNVRATDKIGSSALALATLGGHKKVKILLLRHGAE